MTLEELCKQYGSMRKLAQKLGLTEATLSRWKNRHTKPNSGPIIEAYKRLGGEIDGEGYVKTNVPRIEA